MRDASMANAINCGSCIAACLSAARENVTMRFSRILARAIPVRGVTAPRYPARVISKSACSRWAEMDTPEMPIDTLALSDMEARFIGRIAAPCACPILTVSKRLNFRPLTYIGTSTDDATSKTMPAGF